MFDDDMDSVVGADDAVVPGDENCVECGKPKADCTCDEDGDDEDEE